MGRLSNRKKTLMKNLRNVSVPSKPIVKKKETVPVVNDQSAVAIVGQIAQPDELKLKDTGADKKGFNFRGLVYSDRHQRKLNQKNREMAKGSAKISSYFSSAKPITEEVPVVSEMDKIQKAYEILDLELALINNASTVCGKSVRML